jgi:antitoxin component of MazEF toxin-antitoxin module
MSANDDPESKSQTAPAPKRRYRLAELLAQCEGGPLTQKEREWLNTPDVGREISYASRNVK